MTLTNTVPRTLLAGIASLALAFVSLFAHPSRSVEMPPAPPEDAQVTPSEFNYQARLATDIAGDAFASEVALSGTTAVALSDAGAHVYIRSGNTWSLQTTLVPSDGIGVFVVGTQRVAISGDTVVLGARSATINGNAIQGAAYVFVRTGTSWSEQQRLTASDGAANDTFGSVVDINGNTIIVGAPQNDVGANIDQGAAYAFVRSGSVWTEQQILFASDAGARNFLGHRVSIHGDTAVVSRARSTQATVVDPAVYVFARNGTVWQEQHKLSVCEPSSMNLCWFGGSISVMDNLLAVGNIFLNEGTSTSVGGTYVFERTAGVWTQQQKLLPDPIFTNTEFGSAVSIDGQTIAVGAVSDFGGPGPGAAYIYTRSGSQWVQQQKIQVPNRTTWDAFGAFVSLRNNILAVGAPRDNGTSPYVGAVYIYLSGPIAPPVHAQFDYDGDGGADSSVFRPNGGDWFIRQPGGGFTQQQWGNATDRIAPADYDGDGKTDIAVYRPIEGNWYVLSSLTGTYSAQQWGDANDVIVPGDYTGDGRADHAVWRPLDGTWYIRDISNGQFTITQWGNATDKPIPADYDGNGTFDIMVYRPSEGNWYLRQAGGGFTITQWGNSTDRLVPADYNGDGSADIAVWRPLEGNWFIKLPGGGFDVVQWGASTDIVVPADYDGNGETNIAVWRPADGIWYILNDTGGGFTSTQWGSNGDRPTPNAYVR